MREIIKYRGHTYIAAEESVVETKEDVFERLEKSPSIDWEDKYLHPILVVLREMFDVEQEQISIDNYRKISPFGDDRFGFAIVGTVIFKDFLPEDYGNPPYMFFAQISPDGELMLPIEVEGN